MKPDTNWPAKPTYGTPLNEQPRHELPPKRQRIVSALDQLAKLAESEVIPADADGDAVMLPDDRPYRTPEDFVLSNLQRWLQSQQSVVLLPLPAWKDLAVSPTEGGQSAKINGKLWIKWALLDAVEEHVMLINMQTMGTIMAPIRGDIAVMRDGHCGIVTFPQCSGCKHFEMVEFTPRGGGVPTVFVARHWLPTVSHLIRIVLPVPAPVQAETQDTRPEPVKPVKAKKTDIETSEG